VKHSTQVGVFVIVHVRCCPAVIVPLHSLLNEVVKLGDAVSVTLNVPGLSVTSVPVPEPLKLAGVGLIPETCIAKSELPPSLYRILGESQQYRIAKNQKYNYMQMYDIDVRYAIQCILTSIVKDIPTFLVIKFQS
jgi:hypothetical protein